MSNEIRRIANVVAGKIVDVNDSIETAKGAQITKMGADQTEMTTLVNNEYSEVINAVETADTNLKADAASEKSAKLGELAGILGDPSDEVTSTIFGLVDFQEGEDASLRNSLSNKRADELASVSTYVGQVGTFNEFESALAGE